MFHVLQKGVLLTHNDNPPICDYEGSDYRTRFWENQGREYEDLAERIAIRRLLPPAGPPTAEIGAGFGRLVDMYQGYEHMVLLDYSKSMLREAKERLGTKKYTYVAADIYRMPLADSAVDAISMVRVMHHIADVPAALRHIYRVLRPGGSFLLEFASKLHLKSILRRAVRRQDWSPYTLDPVEFVPLNFDFHPRWMRGRLQEQGFAVDRARAVSHFRVAPAQADSVRPACWPQPMARCNGPATSGRVRPACSFAPNALPSKTSPAWPSISLPVLLAADSGGKRQSRNCTACPARLAGPSTTGSMTFRGSV